LTLLWVGEMIQRVRLPWKPLSVVTAALGVTIALVVVLQSRPAPSSFLYRDAEKAFYIDWKGNGSGVLWATYVNPYNRFQVANERNRSKSRARGAP
jgi:hypothetical protein